MGEKLVCISDSHQRWFNIEKVLRQEEFDELILLGDYFDSFFSPPVVNSFEEVCFNLACLILSPPKGKKVVPLVGNHDIPYVYHNNKHSRTSSHKHGAYYCSGVTANKINKFRKRFFDKGLRDQFFIDNFKLAYRSQGWTFSHAGIVPNHLPYGTTIDDFINIDCQDAWKNFRDLSHQRNYLLSDVGECRGGKNAIGGLVWLDYRKEFFASSQVGRQIFGHTFHPGSPQVTAEGTDCESWCLDTGEHYAVIENGQLEIKKYSEL